MQLDRLDLYPAQVLDPQLRRDRTRVIIADGRLVAATYTPADGPQVILDVQLAGATRQRGRLYTATTVDGDELTIRKGSGCNCGSQPLREMTSGQVLALADSVPA